MSLQTATMKPFGVSMQEELFLHYWLFGSDNVSKDMNDEFWYSELELDKCSQCCNFYPSSCESITNEIIKYDIIDYINEKPTLNKILFDNTDENIQWTYRKVELKTSLIRAICESKEGSRYLQTILETGCEDTIKTFLNKIWCYANKLCINIAGHYVIMKLLSICQSKVSLIAMYFKFIDSVICNNLSSMINNIYSAQIITYSLHCHNINIQNYALYQISYTLIKFGTNLIHNASTNVCGNRIIQSIIEKSVFNSNLPRKPINCITNYVVSNVLPLCIHQYACRVVQAIIKCHEINHECIDQLFKYLPKICNNSNGNYSIQMCLEYSSLSKRSEFIEEIFFGYNSDVIDYSKHGKYTLPSDHNGHSHNDSLNSYSTTDSDVSNDDLYYGNTNGGHKNHQIIIKPNYEKFLFGQYSSHVCDKAFQLASMSQKIRLIKCLINDNKSGNLSNTIMYRLMHHQFGNYVVRNILYHLLKLNNSNGKYLRRTVFNYLLKIQTTLILSQKEITFTYAKHILDMIDRHVI